MNSVRSVLGVGAALACASIAAAVRADAPAGRYQIARYTVYDTKTQITWQRVEATDSMTHADALTYCLDLNLDGAAWRLPTVKELSSLVDVSRQSPAIDPVFGGTTSDSFGSATPLAASISNRWRVDFNAGSVENSAATNLHRVRCVR